ncbi:hypothetical protein [Sinimarinibacterium thermocellulolyticum]|uniref:Lipoprotein n=1 Tax=Sinimarinibacterium thermocellulolyticum TaxID=3170016 RepID=A0ABV2ADC3_9GAMM
MRTRATRSVSLAIVLGLAACQGGLSMNHDAPPVAGFVTDMKAFDAFIATRPTPEAFRRTYPDVTLVLPGQIATKELRFDNSRYFAQLDEQGRISGGKFQ